MIENNARSDLFRCRIEDKNAISGTGAIYVGTGKKTEIPGTQMTVTNADGSTGVVTGAYYGSTGVTPTAVGQIPVSISGTGTAEIVGLGFQDIGQVLGRAVINIESRTGLSIKAENGGFKFDCTGESGSNDFTVKSGEIDIESKTLWLTDTSNVEINIPAVRLSASSNVTSESGVQQKLCSGTIGYDEGNIDFIGMGAKTKFSGQGFPSGGIYKSPIGTKSLNSNNDVYEVTEENTSEKQLTSIIYNIGERLNNFADSTWIGSSANKIKLTRPGLYFFKGVSENFGAVYWDKTQVTSSVSSDINGEYYMIKINGDGTLFVYHTSYVKEMQWRDDLSQDFYIYYKIIK